jgi:hypothetical protein
MVGVSLDLDLSRAPRSSRARVRLIEAVRDAAAHELETDWVEWKGGERVDLSDGRWHAEIARQVIGFANRDPDRATRAFEGCACLLLGVEPGDVAGIDAIDSAQLQQGVSRYLPPDGPEWDPDVEEVDGVAVLVVTVEAPRWGDDIWTFRHGRDPLRDGDIFIRRPGKTDRASGAEMEMLQRRARRSAGQLELDVDLWQPVSVRPVALDDEARDRWATDERRWLLERLPQPGAAANLLATITFERRDRDEFLAAVDEYLRVARAALDDEVASRAVAEELGRVEFAVVNRTERNFAAVAVEISIEGRVAAFFSSADAERASRFPGAPRPWGDPSHLAFDIPSSPGLTVPRQPRGWIDNSGSTQIRFDAIDVRPHHNHRLPTVFLALLGPPFPRELVGRWYATSTSVDGFDSGEVMVPVDQTPLRAEELLAVSS